MNTEEAWQLYIFWRRELLDKISTLQASEQDTSREAELLKALEVGFQAGRIMFSPKENDG